MNTITLDQKTADALIALPKVRANDDLSYFPGTGGYLSLPLVSQDRAESFSLDIRRGGIDLKKGTYQNRAMQIYVLVRLDYGGAPHRNPDGKEIRSPHLHIYREGFGDKWAYEIPTEIFPQIEDPWQTLQNFMEYCNIIEPPNIRERDSMIEEIQHLLDEYSRWLRENTQVRQVEEWVEITTPYLDRHNDYLQIYAQRRNSGYVLTDAGYIIQDLEQSGCTLDTPKRKGLLMMTLNGFGVKLNGEMLEVHTSAADFSLNKHNLIQAMLAVNDLFSLSMPMTARLFYEDVVSWLEENEIRYTPNVKFTGQSGYDHYFDFIIPKSRREPERIIKSISSPNRNTAQSVAFSWIDIKEVRSPDSKAYAILNDTDHRVSETVLDALNNYEVTPIPWSDRERVVEELAA